MTKILLITESLEFYSTKRFKEEAVNLNLDLDCIEYTDLVLKLSDGKLSITSANDKDFNIENYSHLILRGYAELSHVRDAIVTYYGETKKILNYKGYLKNIGTYNKLSQSAELSKHGIPLIDTVITPSNDEFNKIVEEKVQSDGKVILKKFNGTHGEGISLVDHKTLEAHKDSVPGNTMIQKYIDTDHDYRIIILGEKVLGVMKKTKAEGKIVTNYSQGGSVESSIIDSQFIDIALKTAKVLDLEFCGVDLIVDSDNNPYILEANRMPQFEGFEKSTKVNVAKEVLEYLLSR